MSGFRLEIDHGLIRELERLSDKSKIQRIVRDDGAALNRTMKQNAVFTKGYSTGETKRRISTSYKDGGMTAEVGPDTNYAIYLEYGTRFMAAQPFIKKSLDQVAPRFVDHLKELVEK